MKLRTRLALLLALPLTLAVGIYVAHAQVAQDPDIRRPVDPVMPPRIMPWPGPRPFPPVWLPPFQQMLTVDSVHVSAKIAGGIAQTEVTQTWRNDTDRAQEGSYIFPLPEGAVVSDFALYDGDRKMTARMLDKDQASDTYEGIVRRQRDPALLRYVGRGAYEVKLYPVPAHATRKVTLSYAETLPTDGGDTRKYVYSFLGGTLGGGQATSKPPRETTVQITLAGDAPLANVYSPSHEVSVRHTGDKTATVTWEAKDEAVRDDFILYYSTTKHDPVGLSLLAYNVSLPQARTADFEPSREGKRDSGYFLLMASPKTDLLDVPALPKRLVLVLDRSGSMAGPKIEQARNALTYVLQNLRPSDQFNVMTFNETNDVLSPDGLLSATPDNVKRGLAFVKDIQAEGGTNIHDALGTALKMFPATPDTGRQNMVVFLTDGLPTVGETSDAKITSESRTLSRPRGVRLFDFGVGYDVDVHFLDRLAEANKGDSDYVRPEEDIEAKVSRFYKKVASPVLTDVSVAVNGVKTTDVYPRPTELPDLFAGSQLLITGRYTGSGPVSARLTGLLNGKPTSYALATALPSVSDANDFLPRLWATRKIGYLLDAVRLRQTEGGSGGDDPELVGEIVRLSKEYGVITPYTSFLVTDGSENGPLEDRPVLGAGAGVTFGGRRARSGAAGVPSGGGFGGAYAAPAAPMSATSPLDRVFALKSGAAATTQSQTLHAAKGASVASGIAGYDRDDAAAVGKLVRMVGEKTFILTDGVWTDSAYDPAKQTTVTVVLAFSDAHFALLKAVPGLAAYTSLGDSVLVVLENGKALKISASDPPSTGG